jgi:uncharacterized protein (TIGR02246 family)
MSDDERAIRDLIATWMSASQAGDTDKVLSLMTDDVVFMVPGQEPFGKAAFSAASQDMQGARIAGTSEIRELQVLGDWAYLRGHLRILRHDGASRGLHAHHPAQGSRRQMAVGARRQSAYAADIAH